MDDPIPVPPDRGSYKKESSRIFCTSRNKTIIRRVYFGIFIFSLLMGILFVVFAFWPSLPQFIKSALGMKGYFSYFLNLLSLNNNILYGFIIGIVVFAYFLVILSLCSICVLATFYFRVSSPSCLLSLISCCCCSIQCLKTLGIQDSARETSVPEWPDDNSGLLSKRNSTLQNAATWSSPTFDVQHDIVSDNDEDESEDGHDVTVGFGGSSISGNHDPDNNPFDSDSFRRKNKHATFSGFKRKSPPPPSSRELEDKTEAPKPNRREMHQSVLNYKSSDLHISSLRDLKEQLSRERTNSSSLNFTKKSNNEPQSVSSTYTYQPPPQAVPKPIEHPVLPILPVPVPQVYSPPTSGRVPQVTLLQPQYLQFPLQQQAQPPTLQPISSLSSPILQPQPIYGSTGTFPQVYSNNNSTTNLPNILPPPPPQQQQSFLYGNFPQQHPHPHPHPKHKTKSPVGSPPSRRDEDSSFDDEAEWEYDPTGGSPSHSDNPSTSENT